MAENLRTVSFDPDNQDLSLSVKRSKEDADLDRHIKRLTFYVVLGLLAVAAMGAAWLAFLATDAVASAASREWARGTLSAIIGGVVGFAFARK